MRRPTLDKRRPHSEIWGAEDGARYAQNGFVFDHAGNWIPPAGTDQSQIEEPDPEIIDPEATEVLMTEKQIRALCHVWGVEYEPGITLEEIYERSDGNR
jgi:hypothetical protein